MKPKIIIEPFSGNITRTKDPIRNLIAIVVRMRHYQKKWEQEYGALNKLNKKTWEEKMDNWVEEHRKN